MMTVTQKSHKLVGVEFAARYPVAVDSPHRPDDHAVRSTVAVINEMAASGGIKIVEV